MDNTFHPKNEFLEHISKNSTNNNQESKLFTKNENKPEEDVFKTKLRLDRSDNHKLGVVCLPENTHGLKIDTFKPLNSGTTFEDESIIWKSFLNDKLLTRQFRSKRSLVDTDCYFMIVEHKVDNTFLVSPVSNYFMFEPHVSSKSQEQLASKNNIEERLKKITKSTDYEDKLREEEVEKQTEKRKLDDNRKTKIKKMSNELEESNYGWDYEDEEMSEDELVVTNKAPDTEDNPFYDRNLTTYGHQMKSLLLKQEEEEVDEELKQYSDDENSQVSSTKSKVESPKVEIKLEDKILLFLKNNNNKVTVKSILEHLRIREKNDDFRALQNFIQKKCTMTSEEKDGKMAKFIILKQ